MTIDGAIAKYKEITNTDANCPAHCNISCDKCVQESRQIAEWLEELKMYKSLAPRELVAEKQKNDRAMEYSKGFDYGFKIGYNKAVDDFVENISLEISGSLIWGMIADCFKYKNMNDTSDKIVDYVINTANEIAEQLKAGITND